MPTRADGASLRVAFLIPTSGNTPGRHFGFSPGDPIAAPAVSSRSVRPFV